MKVGVFEIIGLIMDIEINYGEERMMLHEINDEQINQIQLKDSDHVQHDGMCLVNESGDC